jgi:hypothetical protein
MELMEQRQKPGLLIRLKILLALGNELRHNYWEPFIGRKQQVLRCTGETRSVFETL